MTVDVTIIIPARNRLWSLPKAVDSCRQTALRTEIIVVDDGSTDGTPEWLQGQRDIIAVKGDGWGKPWGVNKALPLASGAYLRFLDSDDWVKSQANDQQYHLAEGKRADVVLGGYDACDDTEAVLHSVPWEATDDFIAQQLGEPGGAHYSGCLFRREFVQDVPHRTHFPASDFASRDDRCFLLEVAIRHPRVADWPGMVLCHRHHSRARLQFQSGLGSVGSNIQELYIYRQILNLLERRGELTLRRKRAAINRLWPLAHWIGYTNPRDALEVVEWIYRLDPDFVPPEPGVLGILYRRLGFRETERILRARRRIRGAISGWRAAFMYKRVPAGCRRRHGGDRGCRAESVL